MLIREAKHALTRSASKQKGATVKCFIRNNRYDSKAWQQGRTQRPKYWMITRLLLVVIRTTDSSALLLARASKTAFSALVSPGGGVWAARDAQLAQASSHLQHTGCICHRLSLTPNACSGDLGSSISPLASLFELSGSMLYRSCRTHDWTAQDM